jgi:hypothetical protein
MMARMDALQLYQLYKRIFGKNSWLRFLSRNGFSVTLYPHQDSLQCETNRAARPRWSNDEGLPPK